jgi:hypothetical protein
MQDGPENALKADPDPIKNICEWITITAPQDTRIRYCFYFMESLVCSLVCSCRPRKL